MILCPCSSGGQSTSLRSWLREFESLQGHLAIYQEDNLFNPDKMLEIRWHGRGGQGAVTSAEILAEAAISEGKYAQAFPSFGPEEGVRRFRLSIESVLVSKSG